MTDAPSTAAEMREAAAQFVQQCDAASMLHCCDGRECGCYGHTVGDYLAHMIRAIPIAPAPDREALRQAVTRALVDEQLWTGDVEAVIAALEAAGAL